MPDGGYCRPRLWAQSAVWRTEAFMDFVDRCSRTPTAMVCISANANDRFESAELTLGMLKLKPQEPGECGN